MVGQEKPWKPNGPYFIPRAVSLLKREGFAPQGRGSRDGRHWIQRHWAWLCGQRFGYPRALWLDEACEQERGRVGPRSTPFVVLRPLWIFGC